MENKIFFSIIIANYNYRKYVKDAIESALSQDFPKKEVIIIDDGSTDGSCEIIRRYKSEALCIFTKNKGQREANNHAFFFKQR